jgi:hypothetical protein
MRRRESRIAFYNIASKTGVKLPGDSLITCKTSAVAVAVCCSVSSRATMQRSRRASQMGLTDGAPGGDDLGCAAYAIAV